MRQGLSVHAWRVRKMQGEMSPGSLVLVMMSGGTRKQTNNLGTGE